ncbi:SpoIIE family protein phosphatase [Brachybacterium sp. GCM10030268]|uniref:SpoIIE family protein phosphatase n=1 Tax=Brachybacterium sp. GCM10030268 TaxID=3273382 RepID=UPI003612CDAE
MTGSGDPADPMRRIGDHEVAREGFEGLPYPVVIVHGSAHLIAAANAAYRCFAGRDDLLGVPLGEVLPSPQGQRLLEATQQVMSTAESVTVREWLVPRGASGGTGESFVDVDLRPRRDDQGRIDSVLIVHIDVSERVRRRREADFALDQALLPAELPVLPLVDIAVQYTTAHDGESGEQERGGDWFDAVPLAGGRVALMVGDSPGQGLGAAVAASHPRLLLAETLFETGDVRNAVGKVDSVASRVRTIRTATVCLAVLDPAGGELTYCTGGHPPPLIVSADGSRRSLVASGSPPLGTGCPPLVTTVRLEPGETVVLCTGNIRDLPGNATTPEGTAAMGTVEDPESTAEQICREAIERFAGPGPDGDIAVLAARRREEAIPPLRCDVVASAAGLSEVRTALADWLAQLGCSDADRQDVDVAAVELVTNAIEHAYRDRAAGTVSVEGTLEVDGVLTLVVGDHGQWQVPAAPGAAGGRGLWIARTFTDALDIRHGQSDGDEDGTVVILHRRLRRAPRSSLRPERTRLDMPELRLRVDGLPPTVTASGEVDTTNSQRFADHLDGACRGGLHPLTVDLTAVEFLARAGVRVLLEMRERLVAYGHELDLLASEDTPVQEVLDLAGLAWRPNGNSTNAGT